MSELFSTFSLKDITLRNRIAVPPMCQYMAENGVPNDWHESHYTELARGGAGLVIVEATGVAPEGRITPACLGIWNDQQAAEHARIAAAIKKWGASPGLQIAHAGRKASANRPWDGDDHLAEGDARGWQTIAPSAIPFGANLPNVPREMTIDDIERVKRDFVAAAKRALAAGYQWLELHFAHGYLAQSFFSVHSNKRIDEYGGDWQGRGRFLLETLQAVREVWPGNLPLTIRFGVIEFDGNDQQAMEESISLVKKFKGYGMDFLNVSFAFNIPEVQIPWGPAFMAPYAHRIKVEAGVPVASAWGFAVPQLAESAVKNGQLDLVMIGRMHLANPRWSYTAAKELYVEKPSWVLPAPYAHWLERYKL